MKIFATHGVSIESIELFSVACAQEKHYVLGKRPNNFCSSRKYSLANTLLKQTRNKEEQQQQRQTRVVLHHVLGKRQNEKKKKKSQHFRIKEEIKELTKAMAKK